MPLENAERFCLQCRQAASVTPNVPIPKPASTLSAGILATAEPTLSALSWDIARFARALTASKAILTSCAELSDAEATLSVILTRLALTQTASILA